MYGFIITYNRLTLPVKMADFMANCGIDPVFVDNKSDYPPLLEYYKTTPYKVLRMDKNYGYLVVWQQKILETMGVTGEYIVTDPDLDLTGVPEDFLSILRLGLARYPQYDKCGLSLEINDLPKTDWNPANYESQFWQYPKDDMFFEAAVDTTLALYKVPYHSFNALRTNRPYTCRHVPWYYPDFRDMPEDEQYYFDTCRESHSMGGIFTNTCEVCGKEFKSNVKTGVCSTCYI